MCDRVVANLFSHESPQIFLYLKAIYDVSRRISLRPLRIMADDMFRLEDFVGDIHWLDKSYFTHYQVRSLLPEMPPLRFSLTCSKVFDTFVHNEYRRGVGADKVERKEYRIFALRDNMLQVSEENWSTIVSKESRLIMAAMYDINEPGICPACQHQYHDTKPGILRIWCVYMNRLRASHSSNEF